MSSAPSDQNSSDKTEYQAQLLRNRLAKRLPHLKKWARKNDVGCYRLYDKDIPEIPLAIDVFYLQRHIDVFYLQRQTDEPHLRQQAATEECSAAPGDGQVVPDTYLRIYLYQRPYDRDPVEEETWLAAMAQAAARTVGVEPEKVLTRTRMRQRGSDQYERQEAENTIAGVVREQGRLFFVNLSNYLDTGLFMDHRPLRRLVEQEARRKAVLNLFCYTASFSVYAAAGGASRVDSVDLSNTYLAWGEKNFSLNGLQDRSRYRFIRSDVARFLKETQDRWDLIILDPPTFSNSKKTMNSLDINRDWPSLVSSCAGRLNPGGILYFSTNSRQLRFDPELLVQKKSTPPQLKIEDISAATIPEDFRNQKIHRCWKITRT